MCRIDEPFGSHSLEEKTDLTDRFYQILDEYCAEGIFRNLLEKHFSTSWDRELGNRKDFEDALKCAQQASTLPEKITSFVRAVRENSASGRLLIDNPVPVLQELAEKSFPDRFAFAKDVATQVFPGSLFGFYQCFGSTSFDRFVLNYASAYYVEFCYHTILLFQDKDLIDLGEREREELLWAVFIHLAEGDYSFKEHMQNTFSWAVYSSVPTLQTIRFNNAFEYLSRWIEADAFSRSHEESIELLEGKILSYIWNRDSEISRLEERPFVSSWTEDELQNFKSWSRKWLEDQRHEMTKAWCCSVNLAGMLPDDLEDWGCRAHEAFLPLQPGLDKDRAEALIALSIEKNFKNWIKPRKTTDSILDDPDSKLWYCSPFQETWVLELIKRTENLPCEERFHVSSRYLGFGFNIPKYRLPQHIILPSQNLEPEEDYGSASERFDFLVKQKHRDMWNSVLRDVPEDKSCPKGLYPLWTVTAHTRLELGEALVPFADNSLGIIRGGLSENNNPEDVGTLLRILERYAPEKSLRHRLMLLRTTEQPCTNENLDVDRDSQCPLPMSEIIKQLLGVHFQQPSKQHLLSSDEWDNEERRVLILIRTWFAQYCLSRLRLRKGEKAESGNYVSEQVVEQSSIWRQSYLKALTELGVDLQGKAHKAVHFTRKSDPDEDVRSVAQECYKAVRREQNKSQAAPDIRRGLIAAYWWLQLAQRQSLGAPVNHEEALRTRRRMLRHP